MSVSAGMIYRAMNRKRGYWYLPVTGEEPKLGNSVAYPEGAPDRAGSQFQITALFLILLM